MKHRLFFLVLSGSLLAPSLIATPAFEGLVNLQVISGQRAPLALDYMIKGSSVRVVFAGAKTNTIMNIETGDKLVLLHAEKSFFKQAGVPKPRTTAPGLKPGQIAGLEGPGKTEFILSYPCRQYILKEKDGTTEIWLTDGIGGFIGGGVGKATLSGKWLAPIYGRGDCFPLRIVSRDENGKEVFRMEAVRIKPTRLPLAVFAAPANYKETQVAKATGSKPAQAGAASLPKKN